MGGRPQIRGGLAPVRRTARRRCRAEARTGAIRDMMWGGVGAGCLDSGREDRGPLALSAAASSAQRYHPLPRLSLQKRYRTSRSATIDNQPLRSHFEKFTVLKTKAKIVFRIHQKKVTFQLWRSFISMYCFFNYALQRNTLIYNAGIDFRPVIVKVGFLSREFFRCESGEFKSQVLLKLTQQ